MSESTYSKAMTLCGYIFYCIHKLEDDIEKEPVVSNAMPILSAAFFAPLSFTVLRPDTAISNDFCDCVAARLCTKRPSPIMDLFFTCAADFVGCYGGTLSFENSLDYSLYLAFDSVYDISSDEWFDKYRNPVLRVAHSILVFADDLVKRDAPSPPPAPAQETKVHTHSTRTVYWIAIIAVVVAVVAIIIAVSASHSVSNAPSAAAASSAAATEPVSSPPPAEPEPAPEPQPEKLSLPRNGRHYPTYDFSGDAQSSICVHAPSTSNCFVIIKRSSTGKILDRFFVRSGSTVDTYCPKGTLDIYFTFGGDWYGTDFLFGEDTRCQVDREIEFTETIAYEYTLNPVTDGNLHMSEVSIDEALSD